MYFYSNKKMQYLLTDIILWKNSLADFFTWKLNRAGNVILLPKFILSVKLDMNRTCTNFFILLIKQRSSKL